MATRLVGQNCACILTDGGPQDGAPAYAQAVSIKALAKSIHKSATANTANFPALGDKREITQVLRTAHEFEVELYVTEDGSLFDTAEGRFFKVEYKETATMAAYKTFEGVCTKYDLDMPDGPTTEKLTIMCDANGAPGAGGG